jgi:hypothetical protein
MVCMVWFAENVHLSGLSQQGINDLLGEPNHHHALEDLYEPLAAEMRCTPLSPQYHHEDHGGHGAIAAGEGTQDGEAPSVLVDVESTTRGIQMHRYLATTDNTSGQYRL